MQWVAPSPRSQSPTVGYVAAQFTVALLQFTTLAEAGAAMTREPMTLAAASVRPRVSRGTLRKAQELLTAEVDDGPSGTGLLSVAVSFRVRVAEGHVIRPEK